MNRALDLAEHVVAAGRARERGGLLEAVERLLPPAAPPVRLGERELMISEDEIPQLKG